MSLCPIVFAGPSGVGKGTLVKKLMDKFPKSFGFSVSHTTRAPRPGEEDGVHYNFVEKASMEEEISKGMFIEYAHVHTNIYGTSIAAVDKVKSQGKICILDIDIQGVQSVKKSSLEAKYLFINPPSTEALEERLRGRGTETEEKIQVRLKNALGELDFGKGEGNFDASVTNDDLEKCFNDIVTIIDGWYPSVDLASA
jgi:guanylate kinase